MSTCQGALAPHQDCPHGDLCDWEELPVFKWTHLSSHCERAKHGTCAGCICQCHKIKSHPLSMAPR